MNNYQIQLYILNDESKIEYDAVDDILETTFTSFAKMNEIVTQSSSFKWNFDAFQFVFHFRVFVANTLSNFVFVMRLWIIEIELFKTHYVAFRKILRFLKFNFQISRFSNTFNILKKQIKTQLFLLSMRRNNISLNFAKLSIHFAKFRIFFIDHIFKIFIKNFYFFDASFLFEIFFSISNIRKRLHFDITKFRDDFQKLWHFHVWSSFIRTIFDQYAHCVFTNQSFFFFDFVFHQYDVEKCICHHDKKSLHLKRIYEIERNYRTDVLIQKIVTLKIQKTFIYNEISTMSLNFAMFVNEIILIRQFFYVSKTIIISNFKSYHLNYTFDNAMSSKNDFSIEKLLIRRTIENFQVRFLCQNHSLRIELKFQKYFKKHFVVKFDSQMSQCFFFCFFSCSSMILIYFAICTNRLWKFISSLTFLQSSNETKCST